MQQVKYFALCITWFGFLQVIYAQHKTPADVRSIFDALPVDDPAKNSILLPGEDSLQKIKNNLFIRAAVSKSRCFLGEPILLTYTLHSALQSTSTVIKSPSLAGFSVSAMDANNEKVQRDKAGGKNYRVFTVVQVQLTPLQEGALMIDPLLVYNEVRYKENEREKKYSGNVASAAIIISVDPLPVAGRPADFSGAVGNFTLRVTADTVQAAGEDNLLHIEIAGTGNFTALPVPDIAWPQGCEHFVVDISSAGIRTNSFPPSGKKVFDFRFIPLKEGELVIPPVRLSFFDPKKRSYRVVYSTPPAIHVSARWPKPGSIDTPALQQHTKRPYYYWLVPLMVVMPLLFFFLFKRKNNRIDKNSKPPLPVEPPLQRSPGLPQDTLFKNQLQALHPISDTGAYAAAFKQLMTACLQEQTGVGDGTEYNLPEFVRKKDPASAAVLTGLYEQCNQLMYAAGGIDGPARQVMEEKLVSLRSCLQLVF